MYMIGLRIRQTHTERFPLQGTDMQKVKQDLSLVISTPHLVLHGGDSCLFVCVCVFVWTCVWQCVPMEIRGHFAGSSFFFSLWVLVMKLGSSDLVASVFTSEPSLLPTLMKSCSFLPHLKLWTDVLLSVLLPDAQLMMWEIFLSFF